MTSNENSKSPSSPPSKLNIWIEGHRTCIGLRVIPKASKDEIVGVHDGALKIRVRAAPERGKANKAVICLVEQALSPFKFAIIRGETSQDKVASINATPEEVNSRVEEFLAAARKA